MDLPADVRDLIDQLLAAERDAERLVTGLSEQEGTRRPAPAQWSVAECLEHLASGNRVYLEAMREPAQRARAQGRWRQRAAKPGIAGALFVHMMEPPPRWWTRLKAPRTIQPRAAIPLADAYANFMASQAAGRDFFTTNADLDLATIHFPNPFVRGIRFSLATALHVMAAHDRRHLLQAWGVRRALGLKDSNA